MPLNNPTPAVNDSSQAFAPLTPTTPSTAVNDSSQAFAPISKVQVPLAHDTIPTPVAPHTVVPPTVETKSAPTFIQSTYDPTLGITLPTVAPKSETTEPLWNKVSNAWTSFKGLFSAPNEAEQESKYSPQVGKDYDQKPPAVEMIPDHTLGVSIPVLNKAALDHAGKIAKAQTDARRDLTGGLKPPVGDGPGIDVEKTIQDAASLESPLLQRVAHESMGVTPGGTTMVNDLKGLGYGYITDSQTGKQILAPVAKPTYTPAQISTRLTGITHTFNEQVGQISKEIHDLEASKHPTESNVVADPMNPSIGSVSKTLPAAAQQAIDVQIKEKKQQIEDLTTKYNNVASLYGNTANAQSLLGNTPAGTATADFLKEVQPGTTPDWHKFAQTQEGVKAEYDKIASSPDLPKQMTQAGIQYTYVANSYDGFEAQEAYKNPGAGFSHLGKALPQSMIDQWTYNGIIPNVHSLQSSIAYDQKVLKELGDARTNTLAEAKKRNLPIEVVTQHLVDSGMAHSMSALTEAIAAKQSVLTTLSLPVQVGLKNLLDLKANQTYFDDLYQTNAKKMGTLFGIGGGLQSIVDGASNLKYLFSKGDPGETFKQFKTQDYRLEYMAPRVDVDIDGHKAKVPFYSKDLNLLEKGPINWDVLLYHSTKMVTSLVPLLLTGAAAEGLGAKILTSGFAKEVALSGALEAEGLEALAGEGVGYQAANLALKAGVKAGVMTTGYALPGMLMFSPDIIRAEMANKNLTEEQAINLGLTRGLIEGYAFSLNPFEMAGVTKKMLAGEVLDPIQHEAYKTLTDGSLTSLLGFKMNSLGYNLLMNAKYIPKSIGKEALTLIFQQNLGLVGQALATKTTQAMANPDYYNANYELTAQNVLNTTVEAIGTSVPFGLMHFRGMKKAGEFARNTALYQMASAPDWYINHINERLNSGEITSEEAYRQTDIINQVKPILGGLAPSYAEIDLRNDKTSAEKHELKMKLFANRIDEHGLVTLLSLPNKEFTASAAEKKAVFAAVHPELVRMAEAAYAGRDVSESEVSKEDFVKQYLDRELRNYAGKKDYETILQQQYRTQLEEQLITTSEKFQEHLEEIKSYDKLSPDEKRRHDNIRFWSENANVFQNLDVASSEKLLDIRKTLEQRLVTHFDNPYVLNSTKSMLFNIDVELARTGREFRQPQFLGTRVYKFYDRLHEVQADAEHAFDASHQTEERRALYERDYVYEHLTDEEKFLFDTFFKIGLPEHGTEPGVPSAKESKGPDSPEPTGKKPTEKQPVAVVDSPNLSAEKDRINQIVDLGELSRERVQAFKNKDLSKAEQKALSLHVGERINALDLKGRQVTFGDKTLEKGSYVSVLGNDELYRVIKLDEDGKLIVRIGKTDENLDKAVAAINEERAVALATAPEEQKAAINTKFDQQVKDASYKMEIHVSRPEDVTSATSQEKSEYFAMLDKKAAARKVADEAAAAQAAPTETTIASKQAAIAAMEVALTPEILAKKDLERDDIQVALNQLEGAIAGGKDIGKVLEKGNFKKVLSPELFTSLKEALTNDPEATITQLKVAYGSTASVPTEESVVPTKDLSTMSRGELEEEYKSNNVLIRDNLFNTGIDADTWRALTTRQKAVEDLIAAPEVPAEPEPIYTDPVVTITVGPLLVKTTVEAEDKKEAKDSQEETERRVSRVFSPLSTSPQQATAKGLATEPLVQAQIATFEDLRAQHEKSGKSYAELGYHVTVMNNTLPLDSKHQKADVLADLGTTLPEQKVRDGRIAVLTDKDGNIKYFTTEGKPSTKENGYPVYQNLRGQMRGNTLVLPSEPSEESLKSSGEYEVYHKERDMLFHLRKSTEPLTFTIKEITSGFAAAKPTFEPIILGDNISFLKSRKGQLQVLDSDTGVQKAVTSSPTLGDSTLKDDMLAMLDMSKKQGLPAEMKDDFDKRVRLYAEKFLFTHGDGVYGANNRLRLDKEGNAVRLDGKPIEDLLLNIDFNRLGKKVDFYHWDGEKFIKESLPYNSYIAANYKVYQPLVNGVNSFIKLGDAEIKATPSSETPVKEKPVVPETVTKSTESQGQFQPKKRATLIKGDKLKRKSILDNQPPTPECP